MRYKKVFKLEGNVNIYKVKSKKGFVTKYVEVVQEYCDDDLYKVLSPYKGKLVTVTIEVCAETEDEK